MSNLALRVLLTSLVAGAAISVLRGVDPIISTIAAWIVYTAVYAGFRLCRAAFMPYIR